MRDLLEKTLIATAVILAGTLAAKAQIPQPNPPSTQAEPGRKPPAAPPQGAQQPPGGSGADLSHSQGVVAPPDTRDPAVKTPNPPVSPKTPVIPPPGTPGGRQDIEPK